MKTEVWTLRTFWADFHVHWLSQKTCWTINLHDKRPVSQTLRCRRDLVFGIHRIYSRKVRHYGWQLFLGRLRIDIIPDGR